MKTLTKQNRSLYLFNDSESILINDNNIIVGEPPKFIISDCNSTNTVLHESVVTPPEDWTGCKYMYENNEWSLNPDWVEPNSV